MKKNGARKGKLTLSRETLHALESRDLMALAGGAPSDPCTTTYTAGSGCLTSLNCPVTTNSRNTCGSAYC